MTGSTQAAKPAADDEPSAAAGTRKRSSGLARLTKIGASVLLLALVLAFANWHEVWRTLQQVQLSWIALAFVLAFLDRLIINRRWHIFLRSSGVLISFGRLCRVQLGAGFLGSFLPSSVGVDALRIAALCRLGAPIPAVIAATLADRLSLVLATFILGAGMLLFGAQSFIPTGLSRLVLGCSTFALLLGLLTLHKSIRSWVRLTIVRRAPQRVRQLVHDVVDVAFTYRRDGDAIIKVVALTVLALLLRICFVQVIGLSVGIHLSFLDLLVVVPILWVVVMLPITIGGLGVQDAGYVGLMALLGVPASLAVSMSLIEHLIARLGSLPGALFLKDLSASKISTDPAVDAPVHSAATAEVVAVHAALHRADDLVEDRQ